MSVPPKWAYAQPTLFDAQAAESALNEAVERVERNADSGWFNAALRAVRLIAIHRSEFTTDSVWAVLARWQIEGPHEERAMGAVMRRAKSLRWCEPTNQTSRSVRPACHRRDLRIWQSLIVDSLSVARATLQQPCKQHFYAPEDGSCSYAHMEPDPE